MKITSGDNLDAFHGNLHTLLFEFLIFLSIFSRPRAAAASEVSKCPLFHWNPPPPPPPPRLPLTP